MPNYNIDELDPKKFILIKGAKVHNLKNIDVAIPRNKFVVITGLSGSGKSSLAFDTLYAEGQRRYVESLSAYARQFLGKVDKPDVDYIKGVAPAIAIEQKVNTRNTRSTVGTTTEIYDYLKLLYARIGKTFSPISGKEVKRDSIKDVIQLIQRLADGQKVMILTPFNPNKERAAEVELQVLLQQGYSRLFVDGEVLRIEEALENAEQLNADHYVIVDRIVTKQEDSEDGRIADSVETAFYEGKGHCAIAIQKSGDWDIQSFSNRFEADGIEFQEPNVHLFSFNNPIGACPSCEGYGKVIGIDEDLVIPDKGLSVYQNAIVCWKGEKMSAWKEELVMNAEKFDFPIHKPIYDLTEAQFQLLWKGNEHFEGLDAFFEYLSKKSYKIHYRVMLSKYRGKTVCPECKGDRLRKEANYVKVAGSSIADLINMPINKLLPFFQQMELNEHDREVSKRLMIEINNRLQYLSDVGVGYLTLNRSAATLSGGESQRINLATSLGSSLVGSMYILDEPSIGLHPRDTERLIKILLSLRDLGNTVIVVEHDEEIIKAADEVIDLGPLAGSQGGQLIFQGDQERLKEEKDSLTAQYIQGKRQIVPATESRQWRDFIQVLGARQNNLKKLDVKIPLRAMTVISGVSGSGKSSLIKSILYPALKKRLGGYGEKTGQFSRLEGDIDSIHDVQFIDQNPIGKSSRSNPVTYVKAFDEIRNLFSSMPLAKSRGYKPAFFSFNVEGGRCEVCQGEGEITVEMQFMADIHLVCEECNGKRFKDEILEIKYRDKNVADILEMTIEDAIAFFQEDQENKFAVKIEEKLAPLNEVGLGYVTLGQSSGTLSGGEAQRIKLASYLGKGGKGEHILFIFDEPTTGLHFHDIHKLLHAFNALIKKGHSLIVIEHNPEVIKSADWVIDLGPEGGDAGGEIVFQGSPQELKEHPTSYTAAYI